MFSFYGVWLYICTYAQWCVLCVCIRIWCLFVYVNQCTYVCTVVCSTYIDSCMWGLTAACEGLTAACEGLTAACEGLTAACGV